MTYTRQNWANGILGGTPISAERLAYMEEGIYQSNWTSVATTLAEFNNTIDEAIAFGGGEIIIPTPIGLIASEIIIPDGVNVVCVGQGLFTSQSTGPALIFDTQTSGHSRIRIAREREWGDGTDTTSVGIRIKNCSWTTYDILECFNFETGVELRGQATDLDAGTAYCTINIGRITNNHRGIVFSGVTSGAGIGFANGNTFRGGAVRVDGGLSGSYAGTRGLDMSTAGNGNDFSGVNLEGGAVEKTAVIAERFNTFMNCRLESIPDDGFHFLSTSEANLVISGYGNYGPGTLCFKDDSGKNTIIGGRGMSMVGDSSSVATDTNNGHAMYEGQALSSSDDVVFRSLNFDGDTTWESLAGGQQQSFLAGEAFPRVKQDTTGGYSGFGGIFFGRGNIAPDAQIGRTAGSQKGIKANCPVIPSITAVTTTGSPVVVDASFGEIYRITISGAFNYAMGSGVEDAQWIEVEFEQDATGGYAVGFGFATNILWIGGAAPTITTTANKISVLRFSWWTSLSKWVETRRTLDIG